MRVWACQTCGRLDPALAEDDYSFPASTCAGCGEWIAPETGAVLDMACDFCGTRPTVHEFDGLVICGPCALMIERDNAAGLTSRAARLYAERQSGGPDPATEALLVMLLSPLHRHVVGSFHDTDWTGRTKWFPESEVKQNGKDANEEEADGQAT